MPRRPSLSGRSLDRFHSVVAWAVVLGALLLIGCALHAASRFLRLDAVSLLVGGIIAAGCAFQLRETYTSRSMPHGSAHLPSETSVRIPTGLGALACAVVALGLWVIDGGRYGFGIPLASFVGGHLLSHVLPDPFRPERGMTWTAFLGWSFLLAALCVSWWLFALLPRVLALLGW